MVHLMPKKYQSKNQYILYKSSLIPPPNFFHYILSYAPYIPNIIPHNKYIQRDCRHHYEKQDIGYHGFILSIDLYTVMNTSDFLFMAYSRILFHVSSAACLLIFILSSFSILMRRVTGNKLTSKHNIEAIVFEKYTEKVNKNKQNKPMTGITLKQIM